MKKIIAVTLVVIMILSVCCACGGNKYVGEWYNERGKCLSIRSDGTYTLEGAYGTGHWKTYDGGETIELIDFYGEIRETKIETDEKGEYIYVRNYGGNFYRN